MQLLDKLNTEDRELIKQYITAYAECEPISLDKVLSSWNRNKRTMYKALGNQLRVTIPIEMSDSETVQRTSRIALEDLYPRAGYNGYFFKPAKGYDVIWRAGVLDTPEGHLRIYKEKLESEKEEYHPFVYKFLMYMADYIFEHPLTPSEDYLLNDIFWHNTILRGSIASRGVLQNAEGKKLKINAGARPVKTIRKIVQHYGCNVPGIWEDYEDWRNRLSDISTGKTFTGNLVLSIHPIDFMTMSDNTCGWQSCMNWQHGGGYSTGTVEMMNSNMVIVAYLESNTKNFDFNGFSIPNKSWRTLVYVHKDILLVGKSYPYYNKELCQIVLKEVSKLVYKNLNWKYQYRNQLYRDLVHVHENYRMRAGDFNKWSRNIHGEQRHSIFLYTYGMYNDLVCDADHEYWCNRNYVESTKTICVSGRPTCMMCGEPLDTDDCLHSYDDEDLMGYGSEKMCERCRDFGCAQCGVRDIHGTKYYNIPTFSYYALYYMKRSEDMSSLPAWRGIVSDEHVCQNCLKDYYYWPAYKVFVPENWITEHNQFFESLQDWLSAQEGYPHQIISQDKPVYRHDKWCFISMEDDKPYMVPEYMYTLKKTDMVRGNEVENIDDYEVTFSDTL